MSKKRELVPVTTAPKVVRGKKKKADTPSVANREMPKTTANFDVFVRELSAENFDAQFPTFADYTDFRFELPLQRSFDAELSTAPHEFEDGWEGVSHILAILWEKYLGDKFESQMLANFVFTLLLGGVEKGWTAIIAYVKSKLGEESTGNIGDIVNGLNQLFAEGGYDKIVSEIKQKRDELNAPVANTGVKPTFWQKVLRSLSIVLSMFLPKK